jgi:hypothetical protein
VIKRLHDLLAPVRTVPASDRGWRRLLKWAALPLTDRRWAAPMAAVAIGFGLFVGVAISPSAAGTLATGMPPVIEIPGLFAGDEGEEESDTFVEAGGEESFPTGSESESFESFGSEESFEGTEFGTEEEEPFEPVEEEEEEPAEEEEAEVLEGVVVHANPAAGSYALASPTGALSAVHAPKLPVPGTALSVPIETLANGTLAEAGVRKRTGGKKKAKLEGIVTYVFSDPANPAYAVSKRGVSVLVHVHPDPSGAPPQLPVLGAFATVTVDIERPAAAAALASADEPTPPGSPEPTPPVEPTPLAPPVTPPPAPPAPLCAEAPAQPPHTPAPVSVLWQRTADAAGVPFTYSDFAGVVMAICPSEGKLVLSADDLGESGADLTLSVPAKIKTSRLKLGDSVLATAGIGEGGTLTLTGLASDERSKGADDAKAAQGDLVNHLSK